MRRWIAIATVVVTLGAGSGLVALKLQGNFDPELDAALKRIESCGIKDNPILCVKPIVQTLLKERGTTALMAAFSKRLEPASCHYVGHVVGQQSYISSKSIEGTLRLCTRTCDSACVHGAIGEAFAQALGFGTAEEQQEVDLMHLSTDEIRRVGQKLCEDPEACHGVGHTVYQATGNIPRAMEACNGIGPFMSSCYNGAMMEYADILASRNMRTISNVKLPDREELVSLCTDLDDAVQRRSCFRYYTRVVMQSLMSEGMSQLEAYSGALKICADYKTNFDRTACYGGIGAYNGYLVLTDPERGVRICMEIQGKGNQAACFFGQIAVATEERQDKLLDYCPKLPNDTLRSECYQIIFYYLDKFNAPMDNAIKRCGADNKPCMEGYEDYEMNPWDRMREDFPDGAEV